MRFISGSFDVAQINRGRLAASKENGLMWLDDGPAAARGGTELMSRSERNHRMFDLVATAAGVILLAPIFLVTAIAIKLDSHRPIFIREPKFGYCNRNIQLFKFRLISARRGANIAGRLTRIGQILSETSI